MLDRRSAIKSLALSLGITTSVPTLISILGSCSEPQKTDWMPSFFFEQERFFIARLINIILPETDTPSGTDMGLHLFLDKYIYQVFTAKDQRKLKDANNHFVDLLLETAGVGYVNALEESSIVDFLSHQFEVDEKTEQAYLLAVKRSNKFFGPPRKASIYYFAYEVRRLAVLGYLSSEYIGKNVLNYQLTSEQYKGCIKIENDNTMMWTLDVNKHPFQ